MAKIPIVEDVLLGPGVENSELAGHDAIACSAQNRMRKVAKY